jgi:hypothetical protein
MQKTKEHTEGVLATLLFTWSCSFLASNNSSYIIVKGLSMEDGQQEEKINGCTWTSRDTFTNMPDA